MAEKLIDTNIKNEMENSFLDYAMSVIVARALPDVRDGLKPIHRRILYAMNDMGLVPEKKYRKSATIVGEVMGKYHPHGDSSIYDTMVRMAQDFSYRHMLVDGQGNFGTIDGDKAAASRYTEAKLPKISVEMLRDLNKNTVDFVDNYDGSEKEPSVLPSKFPNILVNGAIGIAVGMATNIPPHNLEEVINATMYLIDNPDAEPLDLIDFVKGPDFPTGASIIGVSGIKRAYTTGRGVVTIRAKSKIEEMANGKTKIIVTEIPYQVNKAALITKIAELVREKVIDGITDLRDESNRNGIKIVIELRKDANGLVVLNNLYKHTQLQSSFGINMLALVDGRPMTLNLKEILSYYLDHQKVVIIRRTEYDLDKAENRIHILNGLMIALNNIDEVIKIVKSANNDEEAILELGKRFDLTEVQSKAILEMKIRRLTGLERGKVSDEISDLELKIKEYKEILASSERVMAIIKEELTEIRDKYKDDRRTVIDIDSEDLIEDESLIPVENIVITISNEGYIKRVSADTYHTQNRGGVGIKGMGTNDDDLVKQMFVASTHSYVLFFSDKGKVYKIKGFEIPEYSRQSKGLPIINLIPVDKDENITTILEVPEFNDHEYLLFVTKGGIVKRTVLSEYERVRKTGKIAITLKEEDELIAVLKTDGTKEILIAAENGKMLRFPEDEIREMGRTAVGVKGMTVDNSFCIDAAVADVDKEILVVTSKGFGKRTPVDEYRITHRGTKGIKTINLTEKNGVLVSFKTVNLDNDLIIVTKNGIIIKLDVENISKIGRSTQGVRLINLKEEDEVATITLSDKEEMEEEV